MNKALSIIEKLSGGSAKVITLMLFFFWIIPLGEMAGIGEQYVFAGAKKKGGYPYLKMVMKPMGHVLKIFFVVFVLITLFRIIAALGFVKWQKHRVQKPTSFLHDLKFVAETIMY